MKKFNFIQLIILISVFSIFSGIISKYTYDLIDHRIVTKTEISPNMFVIGSIGDSYFNFNVSINTIVQKAKVSEIICPIEVIGSIKPISVKRNTEIELYILEIINNNESKNFECTSNILRELKKEFHINIEKRIKQIEEQQQIFLNYVDSLKSKKNSYFDEQYKEISFSTFLNYLDKGEIERIGITEDFVMGSFKNGENFFSVSVNLGDNEFLMKKIYEKKTDFYFIDDYSNMNEIYTKLFIGEAVSYEVKLRILKENLNKTPFTVTNQQSVKLKLSYLNYAILILIIANIFAVLFFLFLNKPYLKRIINFVSKST